VLLQAAPGAANEKRSDSYHDRWYGHQKVGEHDSESINEAEAATVTVAAVDRNNSEALIGPL
jgi:hypothetical protein